MPGVELVDSEGRGVEAIDESGVWVGGAHYELDCLIYAIGLRSRHRLRETIRLPGGRSRRAPALGALGRRHANHARASRARLSQPLHRGPESECQPHLQYHAQPHGGGHDDRRRGRPRARGRRRRSRGERGSRGGLGTDGRGQRPVVPGRPGLHSRVLQQRGPAHGPAELLNTGRYPEGPVAFFHFIDAWRTSGDFEGLEFRINGAVADRRG